MRSAIQAVSGVTPSAGPLNARPGTVVFSPSMAGKAIELASELRIGKSVAIGASRAGGLVHVSGQGQCRVCHVFQGEVLCVNLAIEMDAPMARAIRRLVYTMALRGGPSRTPCLWQVCPMPPCSLSFAEGRPGLVFARAFANSLNSFHVAIPVAFSPSGLPGGLAQFCQLVKRFLGHAGNYSGFLTKTEPFCVV